ncbi:MFS transporter [Pseudaestuariivita atlantica]|uniref:MFS transporter n=1 Tax=Pseudaestuariivita atlantica TaxID=1317121 RepID=A0A0L1JN83_9RHOB|nr:MFS transporter [Pseudaestuariivita atlantica]KNG93225.1 MFS transporter [Pseudaestuariivita atlantica]
MSATRTIALYPWFKFFQNLIFWQAIWFLYLQQVLTPSEAILLYAVYDISTTALEVPSGYLSDRVGRRFTLLVAAISGAVGSALLAVGDSFAAFAAAQFMLGAAAAFASGTDSAILYESLDDAGRSDEVERQEVRAWRFTFAALAVSAIIGGVMARAAPTLPFTASALAFVGAIWVVWRMAEPRRAVQRSAADTRRALVRALVHPALRWLFALSVLMYGFSHLPFVFGQPFILEALEGAGLGSEAPIVSGTVTAIMMTVSVAASVVAVRLRTRLGLTRLLLLAFGLQIAVAAVLAATNSIIAIAILFLRMVPDSLSRPFLLARVQPLLQSASRATYLSLQGFFGRLFFAASLLVASTGAQTANTLAWEEIRVILGGYVLAGLVCWITLALTARGARLDPVQTP